jgi:hypothetical protein
VLGDPPSTKDNRPVIPFLATGSGLVAGLAEAVEEASHRMGADGLCVLRREPLVDEECPEVSDVDVVSIWRREYELPERATVETPIGRVFVDTLWIPASEMLDPLAAASYKMLPHLLRESVTVSSRSEAIASMIENIKLGMHERAAWERRIGEQVNFGDAALHEASRNLDFPPAAIFFLQTAHAYYLMALADSLKESVMSILTRPMAKVRRMSAETGIGLEQLLTSNLRLGGRDPGASLDALERVHAAVSRVTDPGRDPRIMGERARGHYLYSISPLELEYREAVARALIKRGDHENANFYLRFWAYSISRCPVVFEDARRGRSTSFYVPYRPFKESVEATCPQIMEDMGLIFGEVTPEQARESIDGTELFRRLVTGRIGEEGLALVSSRDAAALAAGSAAAEDRRR